MAAELIALKVLIFSRYLCCYSSEKQPRKLLASYPLEGANISLEESSKKPKIILTTNKNKKYEFTAVDKSVRIPHQITLQQIIGLIFIFLIQKFTQEAEEWKTALTRARDFSLSSNQIMQEWGKQDECLRCIGSHQTLPHCYHTF